MPSSDWKYIENQFDTATRESFKKMHTLGSDHLAKLTASPLPEVAPLLERFQPLHASWKTLFDDWKNESAAYSGATLAVTNKLDSLTRQVPEVGSPLESWDIQISGRYPPASSRYRAIFPQGRQALSEGTMEERVSALAQLADRLAATASLPNVVTEIRGFATALAGLREAQQEKEGRADAARTALEPKRVEMARMLYGNLGALMDIHRDNPPAVAGYFDLSVLRVTGGGAPPETPGSPAPGTPPTP